ncbi:DUF2267 domain-containing protein [Nonomuraea sp. SYSU D8015]|uniref:DUF2267 domain-containing protein n=1 Tax=Nonomuraea sp. SYSU D8015 TaxID=2593644 RepID=UPI001CB70BF9|nr:DUF2267 domain-containing protein [Nonomuraea sp. SYSU D8015]
MVVHYKELLATVSKMTGLDAGSARAAAEATVAALACALPEDDRRHLLEELPAELHDDFPIAGEARHWNETEFIREVSVLGRRPPEQARVRAQAVLVAIADQDPELIDELHLSDDLRALVAPPGLRGATGPGGGPAPLTDEEVAAALRGLPDWTGDHRVLRRTVVLPTANLDRVLHRIQRIELPPGTHRPQVIRRGDSVELVLRTASADAVTALDVELAERLDDLITTAAAGIASP